MTGRQRHPRTLEWARYLAGELGWLEGRWLRRHLSACAACRQLEAGMAAERAAFDGNPLMLEELRSLRARGGSGAELVAPRARHWPSWVLAGCAAAAAAVIALRAPDGEPGLTAKGGDQLSIVVEGPGGAVALGATCRAGDRLMARYRSERPYLLLLERDGSGAVQVLFPAGGAGSARVAGGTGTTPTSWVLDAVPGRECFAAVFSDAPVDAGAVARALVSAGESLQVRPAAVRFACCDKEGSR